MPKGVEHVQMLSVDYFDEDEGSPARLLQVVSASSARIVAV